MHRWRVGWFRNWKQAQFYFVSLITICKALCFCLNILHTFILCVTKTITTSRGCSGEMLWTPIAFRPAASFLAVPFLAFVVLTTPRHMDASYNQFCFKVLFWNGSNANWDPFISPDCWAAKCYPSIMKELLMVAEFCNYFVTETFNQRPWCDLTNSHLCS